MKKFQDRHKAFWGAVVGAAASLIGSALNASAQRKQMQEQQRQEDYRNAIDRIANMNQAYSNQGYVDDFENKVTYRLGGNVSLTNPRRGRHTSIWGDYNSVIRLNDLNRITADQRSTQFSSSPIFKNRRNIYKCGGRK